MREMFTLDVLYHTLGVAAFALVFMALGLTWWVSVLVGGSYFLWREIAQANLWVEARWLPNEGRNGEIEIRRGSRLDHGWHSNKGGMFTWHRTCEWLMPTIYCLILWSFA